MSFGIEFVATSRADAMAIILEGHLPFVVKTLLEHALRSVKEGEAVYVKAFGHLYNDDHTTSTADIEVRPIAFRKPK